MNTKFFVNNAGVYLGGFAGDTGVIPSGAIEVPGAPSHAKDVWDGQAWVKHVAVPQAVTMRQARLALLAAGKLAAVNAAVAAMPGMAGDAARIEWEFSSEVQRDKALVQALAPVLNLTDAQLDELFITAAAL